MRYYSLIILTLLINHVALAQNDTCHCRFSKSANLWYDSKDSSKLCTGIEVIGSPGKSFYSVSTYKKGEVQSTRYYYANNRLKQSILYTDHNHVKDSTYLSYDTKGLKEGASVYQDGRLLVYVDYSSEKNKTYYNYYINDTVVYYECADSMGNIISRNAVNLFSNPEDLFSRVSVEFYPNGSIREQNNYSSENRNGHCISYFLNGKVSAIKTFRRGYLNGWSFYFNEQGEVIKKEYYVNGKLKIIRLPKNNHWTEEKRM